MSALALSVQKVSGPQATRGAYNRFRRRWMHGSLTRQAIMMPAMSPMMAEGTVARWKKKEGESFAAGDVLLQIESDIAIIDVEANNPGILGKILVLDGTSGVPVEQILALVARDEVELAQMQGECRRPTPIPTPVASAAAAATSSASASLSHFNLIPDPPSTTMSAVGLGASSSPPGHFHFPDMKLQQVPLTSPRTPVANMMPRTPSLFELQSMGAGHRSIHSGSTPLTRGAASAGLNARKLALDLAPQPPRTARHAHDSQPMTPKTAVWPLTPQATAQRVGTVSAAESQDISQVDGAAIRRMIVLNLASRSGPGMSNEAFNDVL